MDVMSDGKPQNRPYKTLGARLKQLREKLKESQAEVAGAVEIEVRSLQKYEQGFKRPPEDILLLLTNHFGMKAQAVAKLWHLAGYEPLPLEESTTVDDKRIQDNQALASIVVFPFDTRVIYTDNLQVTTNEHGVVLHFGQQNEQDKSMVVSRIGMSKTYALEVIEELMKALRESVRKDKQLPEPKQSSQKQDKTD